MTLNTYIELFNLKIRINKNTEFIFMWKNVKKISKKEKFEIIEKNIKKKFFDFIEGCLEEYRFKIMFEIIYHFIFYQKFSCKILSLFLNQIIEFFLKHISPNYLKENFKMLYKMVEGRLDNQKIFSRIFLFLKNHYDSKGNSNIAFKKESSEKTKINNIDNSYENFQMGLENLRNKLDNNKFVTSGILLNKFLLEIPAIYSFSNGILCLFEQTIRILKLGNNFKLLLIFYLARLIENYKKYNNNDKILAEIYVINIYLALLEKSDKNIKFYYNFISVWKKKKIFINNNKFIQIYKFFFIKWTDFKYLISREIHFISIFTKISSQVIFKYFRACFIKLNILYISRFRMSLLLGQMAKTLELDKRDLEHWIHELINYNCIKAKIDRVSGVIYFNHF